MKAFATNNDNVQMYFLAVYNFLFPYLSRLVLSKNKIYFPKNFENSLLKCLSGV